MVKDSPTHQITFRTSCDTYAMYEQKSKNILVEKSSKAGDGHCHSHKEKDLEKKPCPEGRKFHEAIHRDCIESFEKLLTVLKTKEIDEPDHYQTNA